MSDAKPEALTVALLDANGVPYCGRHEPESTMSDDEHDARFCACEMCGRRYLTPQHMLNGIVLAHLEAIQIELRCLAKQLTPDEANKLIEGVAARFGLSRS